VIGKRLSGVADVRQRWRDCLDVLAAKRSSGRRYASWRDFAARLGLVPKQMSSGDCTILGGITKPGNRYLRTLFMQGARVILLRSANWAKHSSGLWLTAAAATLTP
jgi:transposase